MDPHVEQLVDRVLPNEFVPLLVVVVVELAQLHLVNVRVIAVMQSGVDIPHHVATTCAPIAVGLVVLEIDDVAVRRPAHTALQEKHLTGPDGLIAPPVVLRVLGLSPVQPVGVQPMVMVEIVEHEIRFLADELHLCSSVVPTESKGTHPDEVSVENPLTVDDHKSGPTAAAVDFLEGDALCLVDEPLSMFIDLLVDVDPAIGT